jgi:hypothetical protein
MPSQNLSSYICGGELAVGLAFLPIVQFSHHFPAHISFVEKPTLYKHSNSRLPWCRGSVVSLSTQVRGFKPYRSRRIFQGEKILSTPSFGGEVKPSVPCRRFAACKRSLDVTRNSAFRQNYLPTFLPTSSTFRCQDISRRMDVEATSGGSGKV